VRAVLYNRILLGLSFVGLFVAGVLSLAKVLHVSVPCGAAKSCDVVTNHPSSMLFGVFPIAYIGFGAYVVLAALALYRSFGPLGGFRIAVVLGYLVAVVGTVISIGLQFYSFVVIGEMCKWCLTSAATMTLTVIVYALLFQELAGDVKQTVPPAEARGNWEFMLPSALSVLLVFGLAIQGYSLDHADSMAGTPIVVPTNYSLIPASPNRYGDPNAPVTIVEFADLNCPSCQQNSPLVKEFVRQHEGKVQLIYRHFPLPSHETSELASAIDEYAAEKGKFWDYTMAVMATHQETKDSQTLFDIAANVGLDVADIRKRLGDSNDPIFKRVTDDINAANKIGVSQTPTFVVMAPGVAPKAFGASQVRDALVASPYNRFISGQ